MRSRTLGDCLTLGDLCFSSFEHAQRESNGSVVERLRRCYHRTDRRGIEISVLQPGIATFVEYLQVRYRTA